MGPTGFVVIDVGPCLRRYEVTHIVAASSKMEAELANSPHCPDIDPPWSLAKGRAILGRSIAFPRLPGLYRTPLPRFYPRPALWTGEWINSGNKPNQTTP